MHNTSWLHFSRYLARFSKERGSKYLLQNLHFPSRLECVQRVAVLSPTLMEQDDGSPSPPQPAAKKPKGKQATVWGGLLEVHAHNIALLDEGTS